jgi:hypothetical protein
MTIKFPAINEQAAALVRERLRTMSSQPTANAADTSNRQPLTLGPPLLGYNLNPNDIVADKGLDAALATPALTYLLESNGAAMGLARVGLGAANGPRLASVSLTGESANLGQSLASLAQLSQVQNGSYEARLLSVPSGRLGTGGVLTVIWLKSDSTGSDIICPLAPPNPNMTLPGGIQAGHPYTADEFLKMIKPLAQQRLDAPLPQQRGAGGP